MIFEVTLLFDIIFILVISIFALFFIYFGGRYYFVTKKLTKLTIQDYIDNEQTQEKRYHSDKILDNFMKSFISFEVSMVLFLLYKLILYRGATI